MKTKHNRPVRLRKTIDKIVNGIIERTGFLSCQMCGKTAATRFFSAHHIIFRSEAPKHPNLHHKDNLLICCHECHSALHDKKDARQPIVAERKLYDLFPDILSLHQ